MRGECFWLIVEGLWVRGECFWLDKQDSGSMVVVTVVVHYRFLLKKGGFWILTGLFSL